jgi:shikimate kinase
MKIILVGYMGCGKSTIARKLSKKLQIPALDLDKIIEKNYNATVSEIFQQKGEVYFRKIEHELFASLIANKESAILSLGGGTPCYSNNHELLKGNERISIYLKGSIETLFKRLKKGRAKRPLIANMKKKELQEFIAKHLFERSFYYNQVDHIISIDEKESDEVCTEIEKILA